MPVKTTDGHFGAAAPRLSGRSRSAASPACHPRRRRQSLAGRRRRIQRRSAPTVAQPVQLPLRPEAGRHQRGSPPRSRPATHRRWVDAPPATKFFAGRFAHRRRRCLYGTLPGAKVVRQRAVLPQGGTTLKPASRARRPWSRSRRRRRPRGVVFCPPATGPIATNWFVITGRSPATRRSSAASPRSRTWSQSSCRWTTSLRRPERASITGRSNARALDSHGRTRRCAGLPISCWSSAHSRACSR